MSIAQETQEAIAQEAIAQKNSVPIYGPVFNIPKELLKAFTMNGLATINLNFYFSDSSAKILKWDNEFYMELKRLAKKAIEMHRKQKIFNWMIYYATDYHLPNVLNEFNIREKNCVVVGSATPLYETFLDIFGNQINTIEYRKIEHNIPNLNTYTYEEAMDSNVSLNWNFDVGVSVSSIEHSGLGRYGDALDPEGDLKTMNLLSKIIKKDGLLILEIPIGTDKISFNASRVYGKFRLLLLFEKWELLKTYGYNTNILNDSRGEGRGAYFVLKNTEDVLKNNKSKEQLFSRSDKQAFFDLKNADHNRSVWQDKLIELTKDFNYDGFKTARAVIQFTQNGQRYALS